MSPTCPVLSGLIAALPWTRTHPCGGKLRQTAWRLSIGML